MSRMLPPRAEAKNVRNAPPSSCPHIESLRQHEPGTEGGIEAMRRARPEYYGRLAAVMEPIIDAAYEDYGKTKELRFTHGPNKFRVAPDEIDRLVISRSQDPDQKMPTLSGFWRRALVEQVENEIASSKELENVVILENLMDSMKGHKSTVKERGLDKILQAGCGTAAYTTTRLLELLDVSLKSDGYAAAARVAIIRQSTGPLIKAASMSVNDIDTLVDSHMELFLRSNFNRDTGAFPPIFKMINHNRAHFSDEFNSSIDRLTKYTTADERPVIGCPILLNRGQAVKLWEWGLEMGVKAGFLGRD